MREAEVPVTFLPAGRTVYVLAGTRIIEAAAEAGIILDSPCGGEGICGKCRVRLENPFLEPGQAEKIFFLPDEIRLGFRLACQTELRQPMTVFVPETSLVAAKHQILVHIEKTAVTAEDRPIGLEQGVAAAGQFAVAFDIGTTTLAAMLLEANMKSERAVVSRLNPQTRFGDDVLSRIFFARENPQGLQILHESIARAVNEMIGELCSQAGIKQDDISVLTFSGNTTMQHLLCRVDTSSLGTMPFVPASRFGISYSAGELRLHVNPHARAYVFPIIGGFVGGDTVAGILATELTNRPGPALLVDIGTNGEIVLWAGGKLTAASTAAGPAFEGARISCGMRGSIGAIEKVIVDGRLRINVIGNAAPAGLCGSGLIDLAAELLRHKILSPQGKLLPPDQLPGDVLPDLRRRIVLNDGKVAFMLVSEEESATGKALVLTQRDFRELQLAAGAIRAGIGILLNHAGLKPQDLQEVFIAGGFGNFIRRSNAQRIGLLPDQIEHHRIYYRGNTSLAGARLAALSLRARRLAEDIARQTEHVDLSNDPGFQETFAEAMIFPTE
ncbi:MAG: ASKHA domain-containing protein [Thermoguttaceae bacterium]